MDIVNKKWWYFAISALIIVPGFVSLIIFGLRLGIDYTGGTLFEVAISDTKSVPINNDVISQLVTAHGVQVASVSQTGTNTYLMRTKPMDDAKNQELIATFTDKFGGAKEVQFETVGATVSGKLSVKSFLYPVIYPLKSFGVYVPDDNITKAFSAVFWASVAILIYIAYSFRKMPKPASSWRFGIAAIAALLHDVFLVIGVFSILGHFFHVEIDALFITALLTVMGFSVHDTIVVFDRIRENLEKYRNMSFTQVANISMVQTLGRSLATSLTVVLVLLALLLFGGVSVRWFVAALLVGVISGTYSSIFNATPILVVWDEKVRKKN